MSKVEIDLNWEENVLRGQIFEINLNSYRLNVSTSMSGKPVTKITQMCEIREKSILDRVWHFAPDLQANPILGYF
jgi:hypothetical protein